MDTEMNRSAIMRQYNAAAVDLALARRGRRRAGSLATMAFVVGTAAIPLAMNVDSAWKSLIVASYTVAVAGFLVWAMKVEDECTNRTRLRHFRNRLDGLRSVRTF